MNDRNNHEVRPIHTPMKVSGTAIYLANKAGSFDVRNCPDALALAAFIGTACNTYEQAIGSIFAARQHLQTVRRQEAIIANQAEGITRLNNLLVDRQPVAGVLISAGRRVDDVKPAVPLQWEAEAEKVMRDALIGGTGFYTINRVDPEHVRADPAAKQTYETAATLALSIWRTHYSKDSPRFEVLPDLDGVISQIDNMVTGLTRKPALLPVQPWDTYRTGIKPWSHRVAPGSPLQDVADAMQLELNDLRAKVIQQPLREALAAAAAPAPLPVAPRQPIDVIEFGASLLGFASETDFLEGDEALEWVRGRWLKWLADNGAQGHSPLPVATQDEITDDLIYPPKAMLKREDWDPKTHKPIPALPVATPQDELYFNAQRLRNVATLVGLVNAVPQDDAILDGARGAVLGMVAAKLRALPVAGQAGQVAMPDLLNMIRAAYREGQSGGDVAGPTDTTENWRAATEYAESVVASLATPPNSAAATPVAGQVAAPELAQDNVTPEMVKAMRFADMAADYTGSNVSESARYTAIYRAAILATREQDQTLVEVCTHPKVVTHYTGDGHAVEFCPDCGTNTPSPFRYDEQGSATKEQK